MPSKTSKQINVAVIGSGLAGLSAAYLLSENKDVEVHLFEKNTSLGMDAASISIGPEKNFRIDVPMRSYMSGYYSHLSKLYEHLQIPAKRARFSFGWYRIMQSKRLSKPVPASQVASFTENHAYLVYSGSRTIGRLGTVATKAQNQLAQLMQQCWQSIIIAYSYLWLMCIALWSYYRGHLENPDHSLCNMTLGDFFKRYYIHPYFAHEIFVPLFAAVCTNSYQSMLSYPASDILEYMAMGLFQESYVAGCGVQQVVKTMSAPLQHVHLETQITAIQPNPNRKHRFLLIDEHDTQYDFDHIIFATQGNQACSMLSSYADALKPTSFDQFDQYKSEIRQVEEQMQVLKQFEYDTALVINHTDTRLLPSNPDHWKALNLAKVDKRVDPGHSDLIIPYPHDTTMTTHILNMTHNMEKCNEGNIIYMQTTNPCIAVDPKKVLSVAWFERATVTLNSKRALSQLFINENKCWTLGPCQGQNGFWFVGSYCWKGIPLLEGCVASAEHVAQGIAQAENIHIQRQW
ncbi:hypothetical protein A0J61_07444 [Choanephora cucurbitarum]|uniref:Amine oxidase domain-containing protein n=1 Tax=Choanephora cucurbitarum TaxID=101091 RepID=A0A1C7N7A9_9FUNG|nr:hypothetical protein A0J61_07444 [Choanephora cucurbitarum]